MIVIHSPASPAHDPDGYFRRGRIVPHPERAIRYHVLRAAVAKAGYDLVEADDRGLDAALAVHDPGYVDLLRTAWTRKAEIPRWATRS